MQVGGGKGLLSRFGEIRFGEGVDGLIGMFAPRLSSGALLVHSVFQMVGRLGCGVAGVEDEWQAGSGGSATWLCLFDFVRTQLGVFCVILA